MRSVGQLADRETLKRLYSEKPAFSEQTLVAIFNKHRLGRLEQFVPLGGNVMNAVYDIRLEGGQAAILKIQVKPFGATDLEHRLIGQFRSSTTLPVSSWSILDTACDVCPYPYVIFSKLPGQSAREMFEGSDSEIRQQLSRGLGRIVGAIHSQKIPDYDYLGDDRLSQCRAVLEATFLKDVAFHAEIMACVPSFCPRLAGLLESMALSAVEEEAVLLWKDPVFHNMLVEKDGQQIRVSGIYDFQFSSIGSRAFDLIYVEGDFGQRAPREVYGDPAYFQSFKDGYEGSSGCRYEINESHRALWNVLSYAREVRNWWDWGRVLHPKTPAFLDMLLNSLSKLS